jgi:hypothetical protein
MLEVQFGAPDHERLHRFVIPLGKLAGILTKPFEEGPVADDRHLERFRDSTEPIPALERAEEIRNH